MGKLIIIQSQFPHNRCSGVMQLKMKFKKYICPELKSKDIINNEKKWNLKKRTTSSLINTCSFLILKSLCKSWRKKINNSREENDKEHVLQALYKMNATALNPEGLDSAWWRPLCDTRCSLQGMASLWRNMTSNPWADFLTKGLAVLTVCHPHHIIISMQFYYSWVIRLP